MAVAVTNNINMMEDIPSFRTILVNFGLIQRAKDRLTEVFPTANELMASNVEQIKSVVTIKTKCIGITRQKDNAATLTLLS